MNRRQVEAEVEAEVVTTIEMVTPAMAASWLKFQHRNRNIITQRVRTYAEAMRNGDWQLNGEGICFNTEGQLLNGQHRLAAVIQADCPVRLQITRGIANSAFATIDQGKPRTAANVFTAASVPSATEAAAVARLVCIWDRRHIVSQGPKEAVPTATMLLEYYPQIADSVRFVGRVRARLRGLLPPSEIGFLHWLFGGTHRVERFFEAVADGEGLIGTDPQYRLRERLIGQLRHRARLGATMRLALAIKAWNASYQGRPLRALLWHSDQEAFPAAIRDVE